MQAEVNLLERITRAYVAYRGVRLLCVVLVLVSALLLFVLAGGFPPYAWRLLAQTLPQFPTLLATRGPGVLLALLGVLLLSVTLLIAWGALLWLSWRMLAYWRYEWQELRNFAADLEEAQYQAEEMDEYSSDQYADDEDLAEVQSAPRQAAHAGAGQLQPPATRRRVIYPLSPMPDEDDVAQAGPYTENNGEPFFIEEEEEESEMRLYRDEDDDEMIWTESPAANAANPCASEPNARPGGVAVGGGLVYDQQIIEHSSPSPTSAHAESVGADNIKHSSYGRILPFSAAPSAGALPHLTTTLYDRVPMPRSVTPRSTDPLTAHAQPRRSVEPTQPAKTVQPPTQAARPAQHVAPTQPAKSAQPSAPPAQPPAPVKQSSAPPQRPPAAGPTHQPVVPQQHGVPTRPTKQPATPPAHHATLARPTHKLTALPQAPAQQSLPVQPAQQQPQHSAMQSLVELISTVPLAPSRAPIPIARPLVRSETTARRPMTQLVVSTGLDVGLKRRGKPNEDSLLALQNTRDLRGSSCPVGFFVVADGMGGHDNGQEASHLVIQSLSKTVVPSIIYGPTDDNYAEMLAEGVHHANLEIYQRNRQAKADMGTTIVAALIVDSTAYVVSAGDSRVYLYRSTSGLTQVTRDHSTVARLVESGLIKPEDVYTHPRRNEIYRSLGHHPSEDLDKFILALQPEDVLLLCSDGLWEMVRDAHIREIIASTANQPTQTSAALVQAALDGGGKDNISVIVVYVKAAMDAQNTWAG